MTAANIRKMTARAGEAAKIGFPVHPHMLRHACGFKLALGHRNIQHTVRYTGLSPDRFKGFWRD